MNAVSSMLFSACSAGDLAAAIAAVAGGADVNLITHEVSAAPMTPLMVALIFKHARLVRLLVQLGADVNLCISGPFISPPTLAM